MRVKHPLASSTWGPDELAAAESVLRSGQTTMGAQVAAFEDEFATAIGTTYAVMVNSGSSANLLMVAAYTLRYGPGIVIAPALSWPTSYNPFQQYGWRFHFVDIDDSLCIDTAAVRVALDRHQGEDRRQGAVILGCNILGNACDYGDIPSWSTILEDNCESLGAVYGGQRTGTFGVMATHSLFYSHHLCTMEGGVITTDDRYFYELLTSLRSHGWTRHLPADNVLGATVGPFNFIMPGYNVRPMEVQAAIGRVQLGKLDAIVAQRRANAEAFPYLAQREVGESSWFGFAVDRTPPIEAACETRPVVAGNILRTPLARYYEQVTAPPVCPVADRVMDTQCYVGNHATPIDWAAVFPEQAVA